MKNRFDLEQEILSTAHFADQMRLLEQMIDDGVSRDDIGYLLNALAKMLEAKVDRTFDTFTQAWKLDKYKDMIAEPKTFTKHEWPSFDDEAWND